MNRSVFPSQKVHSNQHMALAAALMFSLILVAPAFGQQQPEARVLSTSGRVEMRATRTASWSAVEAGMELPLGATISTGFGANAQLEIGPATLEVQQLTRLTLEELAEREGLVQSDLFLQVGRVRADVRTTEGRQSEFRMRSPVATAAVRGTSFQFDGINLQVESGNVWLGNQLGEGVVVGGGEESSSSSDDDPPVPPADQREAATTVQIYVSPPGETRTAGVRTTTPVTSTTGGLSISWTILGYSQ